ncbi:hypothetical protein [Gimesia algae]|uniref:Outer membrane lipoprotein-sorting protein n=1 Tax=Gimesia algae TaxID=2527971 RepID=A0A517VD05_9PLAN|nr:hypothetical protein [Gimesia algae]QDT90888.1 hypothetical protein Pan161_25420 [Gimesia algae]
MLLNYIRIPLIFCCACSLLLLSGQGTARGADAVPERLIKAWEASRNRFQSLYLKIRNDTTSPYELTELARMTGRVSFVKATEIVAFDAERQIKRFQWDEQEHAKKDEQGNYTLETIRSHEWVTATEGGLNRNVPLPGNVGMQYGKNYYPFRNLVQRSTYMRAIALYVEDPLASPEDISNAKWSSLPEALKLRDFQLLKEDADEFVISWTGKIPASGKPARQVFTISKKYGFRVKSEKFYLMPQEQLISSCECRDFREAAKDIWLPYEVKEQFFRDDRLLTRTTMKVLDAKVNQDISRDTHFEFAPGTQVTDLSQMTSAQVKDLKETRNLGYAREFTVGGKKSGELK